MGRAHHPDNKIVGSGKDARTARATAERKGYKEAFLMKVFTTRFLLRQRAMRFDYAKYPDTASTASLVHSSLASIHITSDNNRTNVVAFLDSGADHSLFNIEIGWELGLKLNRGRAESFTGIAGEEIVAFFYPVTIQVAGMREAIKIEVGFTDSPGVHAILGQADFFQHYAVKFERYKERIEINPARK